MRDVFDIHAHTHTHFDDYFETMELKEDILESKNSLLKNLNINSSHLCWPRGKYDENSIKIAKECGFDMLYTIKRGINTARGSTHEIKRISMKKSASWLRKTLFIFSNDFLGNLYTKIRSR